MLLLVCAAALLLAQTPADVRFQKADGTTEVVAALPAAPQAKLPTGKLTQEQGEEWLRVCRVDPKSGKAGPPMLGSYQRRDMDLVFRPRFPLEPGQLYRAQLGPDKQATTADYRVPSAAPSEPARVVNVYPTGDVLPANHLKFYIYFSQPMRGGKELFNEFAILDADGKEVYDPWLHDEIWDEKAGCLILYIHPGRIKWGVLLRELLGPVLLPDRRYSFRIRGALLDAEGRPMGKDYTKKFRTSAEDHTRVKVEDWKLVAPQAETREPLVVAFPRRLDHKSLERFLTITNAAGKRVDGAIEIGKEEKSWTFRPAQPWTEPEYRLNVDPDLEDVAGNNLRRPFDTEVNTSLPAAPQLHVTFRPRS
jgi:hypothetical protein